MKRSSAPGHKPPGRRRGFQIFSVAGIPITIDPSWLFIFFLVAWSAGGFFRLWLPAATTATIVIMGLLAAVLLFTSVLLHELSHSLVARLKGLPVEGITLFIFGGVSQMGREPETPSDEVQIAGAGPLASLLLAGLFMGLYLLARLTPLAHISALTLYLGLVNLALAIFNLMPAFPLDGGRVLRAFLWSSNQSFTRATVVAAQVGRTMAFMLMGLGVLVMFTTGTLNGLWWVLIGLFLNQAAGSSARGAMVRKALSGHLVRDVMVHPVATLDPDRPLNLAVEESFLANHFAAYPVVQDRRVRGLLSLEDVRKRPRERWPYLSVADAMTPLDDAGRAFPDEDVMEALERMVAAGHGRLVVVDQADHILGFLTRRDIMDFMQVQTNLG